MKERERERNNLTIFEKDEHGVAWEIAKEFLWKIDFQQSMSSISRVHRR